MRYRFYIMDVFTRQAFGGNQLAVLPEASGISAAGMQHIAREFNFAETTFVVPASNSMCTRRVRIFTPKTELKFAGHPTIGTACALLHGGHVGDSTAAEVEMLLEEGVGPIRARVRRDGMRLEASFTMDAVLEQAATSVNAPAISKVLQLPRLLVLDVFCAGIGVNFTFVQLRDASAVDAAVLDPAAWQTHMAASWAPQIYLFARDPGDASRLYARMFAPAFGVAEDPASGSACGALAAVLVTRRPPAEDRVSLSFVQGVAMGRRSEIEASAVRTGKGMFVSVGGACVHFADGDIEVPLQFASH